MGDAAFRYQRCRDIAITNILRQGVGNRAGDVSLQVIGCMHVCSS